MTRIHKRGLDPIPYPALHKDVAQMGLTVLELMKSLSAISSLVMLWLISAIISISRGESMSSFAELRWVRGLRRSLLFMNSLMNSLKTGVISSASSQISPGHHANAFNKLLITQCESKKTPYTPLHHRHNVFLVEAYAEDNGLHGRHFILIIEDSFQIQSRHISQNGLFQEENIRPQLDHLLHKGKDLFRLALEIFDDDGAEEVDVLLPVQAIYKLLQILFIMSDYGQLDHLLPPGNIHIAGVPSTKLNPQKSAIA